LWDCSKHLGKYYRLKNINCLMSISGWVEIWFNLSKCMVQLKSHWGSKGTF
jgi:hypothetical protein